MACKHAPAAQTRGPWRAAGPAKCTSRPAAAAGLCSRHFFFYFQTAAKFLGRAWFLDKIKKKKKKKKEKRKKGKKKRKKRKTRKNRRTRQGKWKTPGCHGYHVSRRFLERFFFLAKARSWKIAFFSSFFSLLFFLSSLLCGQETPKMIIIPIAHPRAKPKSKFPSANHCPSCFVCFSMLVCFFSS